MPETDCLARPRTAGPFDTPADAPAHTVGEERRRRIATIGTLAAPLAGTSSQGAWESYKPLLLALAERHRLTRVMEIGGGRTPLLSAGEIASHGMTYTVNDISRRELSLAPPWTEKAHFDITGPLPDGCRGTCDLLFSHMVLEHVPSGEAYYRNVFALLKEGGVSLTFYPTLYSPPFVINRLLPETMSRRLLTWFFEDRTDDGIPKFPARYSWCHATRRAEERIRRIGFSHVRMVPFYGHGYFRKIPVVRGIDGALHRAAQRFRIRALASYAFCIALR